MMVLERVSMNYVDEGCSINFSMVACFVPPHQLKKKKKKLMEDWFRKYFYKFYTYKKIINFLIKIILKFSKIIY